MRTFRNEKLIRNAFIHVHMHLIMLLKKSFDKFPLHERRHKDVCNANPFMKSSYLDAMENFCMMRVGKRRRNENVCGFSSYATSI